MIKAVLIIVLAVAAAATPSRANCIFDSEDNLECSVR